MLSATATSGDTSTNATPVSSQCANVLAVTICVRLCPLNANCSSVPYSASVFTIPSSDNSDDSSAATQSTPGAMSRSCDNLSRFNPNGNKVVTIKKNTNGCNNCS